MAVMSAGVAAMHGATGRPVPVVFDSPALARLYVADPRIEVRMEYPDFPPLFSTDYDGVGRPDVARWFVDRVWEAAGGRNGHYPRPWVSKCMAPDDIPSAPTVGVVHGSAFDGEYAERKTLPLETRLAMLGLPLAAGFRVAAIGMPRDFQRFWADVGGGSDATWILDRPLRQAVGALQACVGVIANDTGLAHMAGASRVPTLCLCPNMETRWQVHYGDQHHYERSRTADGQIGTIRRWLEALAV
jgi:hypothetical protein